MKLTISIKTIRMALAGLAVLSMSACEGLLPDNKVDLDLTDKNASQAYTNLKSQGMMLYDYLPTGYNRIDGAMLAAATDEADHAPIGSDIEKFQLGTWNAVTNPDNNWSDCYRAIRLSALFLQNSENYETIILRDTSTASKLNTYKTQCADLKALRAEARILNAYMYFELLKRFGGVPLIDKLYSLESHPDMERSTYDQVVTHIVGEIDDVLDNDELEDDWYAYDQKQYGRFTQGAALALKSRILLYRASPQNNPSGDTERWKEAAQAAHDLIELSKYTLEGNYGNLFSGTTSHQSKEVILAYMTGANNTPETDNYPISTNGGKTGTCPSANLVDAYENADGTPFDWNSLTPGDDPYAGRDPRLQYSIVVNDSQWNGRTMQCYDGGADGSGVTQATTTGYYLKKFLTDGLDLEKNQTSVHSWILFRYAEILLNYAEAMNEAYGPDTDPFGDGKTARWAVNEVRGRVGMPARNGIGRDGDAQPDQTRTPDRTGLRRPSVLGRAALGQGRCRIRPGSARQGCKHHENRNRVHLCNQNRRDPHVPGKNDALSDSSKRDSPVCRKNRAESGLVTPYK